MLANFLIIFAISITFGIIASGAEEFSGSYSETYFQSVLSLYFLAILIPFIAARTRRLHDVNKSGWFQLLTLVPFGAIVLLVFCLQKGDQQSNEYGPVPQE